ncbi:MULTISPECIES: hypothetical protein [Bradyrhizobium]|uniref:hypothetical protein n=1 Tax=Bradyrhizobium TaxID=374 RepID=UPI001E4A2B9B|nr:hypothetical protein [Bradyrhizobium canariense]MBM7481314.1 hypothetical protein [Bradyrhizobium canariense]UFW70442.1 hypothetical protein BcanWU425_27430 [Bradyrhizobium canariense]
MSSFPWPLWQKHKNKSLDRAEPPSDKVEPSSEQFEGGGRRHLLQALSVFAAGSALGEMSNPAEAKDSSDLPPPRRALTGRDEAGKSVLKSFEVTPKLVEIDANPGLTFYELYMTEGVPGLTGLEPDPMSAGTKGVSGACGDHLSIDLVSAEAS